MRIIGVKGTFPNVVDIANVERIYNNAGSNNGKPDDFSDADKATLRNALLDISQKLTNVAEKLN